jgi:hypothetical protein
MEENFSTSVHELPEFKVDLCGWGSRVIMDGTELKGIVDVKIHQPLEGTPMVTITFRASSVGGI